MNTKQNDAAAIAAFIARKGVTACPPMAGNARSLRAMRREDERQLMAADPTEERHERGGVLCNGYGEWLEEPNAR